MAKPQQGGALRLRVISYLGISQAAQSSTQPSRRASPDAQVGHPGAAHFCGPGRAFHIGRGRCEPAAAQGADVHLQWPRNLVRSAARGAAATLGTAGCRLSGHSPSLPPPRSPNVWIKAAFVGGCDTVKALQASGELAPLVSGLVRPERDGLTGHSSFERLRPSWLAGWLADASPPGPRPGVRRHGPGRHAGQPGGCAAAAWGGGAPAPPLPGRGETLGESAGGRAGVGAVHPVRHLPHPPLGLVDHGVRCAARAWARPARGAGAQVGGADARSPRVASAA